MAGGWLYVLAMENAGLENDGPNNVAEKMTGSALRLFARSCRFFSGCAI